MRFFEGAGRKKENVKKKLDILQYILVICGFVGLIICALRYTTDNPRYDLILASGELLRKSYFTTISISLVSLAGTLLLGFLLFVMLRSSFTLFRAIAEVFSEIIMGTPLLVMIFLVVYPFGRLIDSSDKVFLGTLAMILYNAPYVANAYQSAAAVVTEEQYTVMDLYQFKWYEKYWFVILPQMIGPFLPALMNNLSSVIKSSALLNVISISEITYITTTISSRNFAIIEGYYVCWILYLVVTIPLSLLAKFIGKKVCS